jgi:hypothetical protein
MKLFVVILSLALVGTAVGQLTCQKNAATRDSFCGTNPTMFCGLTAFSQVIYFVK